MALKGNVETVSLVEIFEFLHAAGHTGILRVSDGKTVKVLKFHKGLLYYPKRDRNATYKLGKLLLKSTSLTPEQLEGGLKAQKEKKGSLLGEVLVDLGFVTHEDVQRVVSSQYKEEVFDLFLWKKAHFEFQKDVLPDGFAEDIQAGRALPLQPPQITMEAANRIDEWKRIHRAIPSLKLICEEVKGKTAAIDDLLLKSKIDPDVIRFDGRNSIAQVFEAWEHGYFDSHRLVFQLLQDGLIVPIDASRIQSRMRDCLAKNDYEQALRYYEMSIECVDKLDVGVRLGDLLFSKRGIGGTPQDHSVAVRTSGKRAVYMFLGVFNQEMRGTLSVLEGDNRRVITLAKDFVGVETWGTHLTPDVLHYVLRRGLIRPSQIDEINKKRQKTGRSTQQVLIEDLYITQADWIKVLTDKIVDEVLDLFFWSETHVELKNRVEPVWGQRQSNLALQMPYAVEGFLDELRRHLAEIERYLEEIPSVRGVFRDARATPPPAGTKDVLLLFDGRRTVMDVLGIVRWVRQDLLQFMHRALEAGNLRPLTRDEYEKEVDLALAESRFRDAQALCFSAIDAEVEPDLFWRKLEAAKYAEEESVQSSLEGDFESISLADILQSLQRKQLSGTMEVSDGKRAKTIFFQRGDVYILRKEAERNEFTEMFLEDEAVESLSNAFGGDLVEKGLVDESEIAEELAAEIKEEVWDMFLWEGARFVFERNKLPPDFFNPPKGTTRLMLRTDAFMLEAVRRINEWEDLKARIPDPSVVYKFVSPEKKMEAIGRGHAELLYLLDGRRSLAEVVRISGMQRSEVYRIIAELEDESALRALASDEVIA
ncbi:MAG TPA: DUF4388 domain-containing protein [Planctomycetota bacterium]|nr:DUF4388 domain-containing protein [Planctomycetota bacterium]